MCMCMCVISPVACVSAINGKNHSLWCCHGQDAFVCCSLHSLYGHHTVLFCSPSLAARVIHVCCTQVLSLSTSVAFFPPQAIRVLIVLACVCVCFSESCVPPMMAVSTRFPCPQVSTAATTISSCVIHACKCVKQCTSRR